MFSCSGVFQVLKGTGGVQVSRRISEDFLYCPGGVEVLRLRRF